MGGLLNRGYPCKLTQIMLSKEPKMQGLKHGSQIECSEQILEYQNKSTCFDRNQSSSRIKPSKNLSFQVFLHCH